MERIIIVGAGAAGLSLAHYLSHVSPDDRSFTCTLIEPATKAENDRTWCYWGDHFDFDHLAHYSWSDLEIVDREGNRTSSRFVRSKRKAPGFEDPYGGDYRVIAADRFYEECRKSIQTDARFEWIVGRVEKIEESSRAVTVSTSSGRSVVYADTIFDTVFGYGGQHRSHTDGHPPRQSFVGWEVTTHQSVWNPGSATLMDFSVAETSGAFEFMYTLPTSTREALVEFTVIGSSDVNHGYLEDQIATHLETIAGVDQWHITRREKGEIPLFIDRSPFSTSGGVVRLGVQAGAARPSTGYAFRSIVETSRSIVSSYAASGRFSLSDAAPHTRRRPRFFDRVFLNVLRYESDRLPDALFRLFDRNSQARVLTFLSGRSTLLQEFAIVASLPWGPFIRGLYREIRDSIRDSRPKSRRVKTAVAAR